MSQRLFFLDGMRGWAAFAVMLLHIYAQIMPPIDIGRLHMHLWWPFTGSFAVALFFLVSGFSLSVAFIHKDNKRLVMRTAVGRYLRLTIPIFFTCVLASILLNTGLIPAPELRPHTTDRLALYFSFDPTVEHLLRFVLYDVYFNHSAYESYAPPLWTMAYELFGSMGIAALLLLFGKPSRNRLVYALSAIVLFVFLPWYSLFVLGIISVESRDWLLARAPAWLGLVLMGLGCIVSLNATGSTQLLVVAATLFFVGAMQAPRATAFFSTRFSQWLGEISFPLYLVHVPVAFTALPIYTIDMESNLLRFLAGSLAVIASVLVAIAFIPINTWAMQASRWAGRAVIRDKPFEERAVTDR